MTRKHRRHSPTERELAAFQAKIGSAKTTVDSKATTREMLEARARAVIATFGAVSEDTEIIEYLAAYKRAYLADVKSALHGTVTTTSRALKKPMLWDLYVASYAHLLKIADALEGLPRLEEEIVRLFQQDENHLHGDITRALAGDLHLNAKDKDYKAADNRKRRILERFEEKRQAQIESLHHLIKGTLNAACDNPDAKIDHVVLWHDQLLGLVRTEADRAIFADALTVDWPDKQSEIDDRIGRVLARQSSHQVSTPT